MMNLSASARGCSRPDCCRFAQHARRLSVACMLIVARPGEILNAPRGQPEPCLHGEGGIQRAAEPPEPPEPSRFWPGCSPGELFCRRPCSSPPRRRQCQQAVPAPAFGASSTVPSAATSGCRPNGAAMSTPAPTSSPRRWAAAPASTARTSKSCARGRRALPACSSTVVRLLLGLCPAGKFTSPVSADTFPDKLMKPMY